MASTDVNKLQLLSSAGFWFVCFDCIFNFPIDYRWALFSNLLTLEVSSDGRTSLRVPSQGFVAIHHGAAKKVPCLDDRIATTRCLGVPTYSTVFQLKVILDNFDKGSMDPGPTVHVHLSLFLGRERAQRISTSALSHVSWNADGRRLKWCLLYNWWLSNLRLDFQYGVGLGVWRERTKNIQIK